MVTVILSLVTNQSNVVKDNSYLIANFVDLVVTVTLTWSLHAVHWYSYFIKD